SRVAHRQSGRLLTGRLLVRVQSRELPVGSVGKEPAAPTVYPPRGARKTANPVASTPQRRQAGGAPEAPDRPRAHLRSRVAQRQSGRLLTGRLLVRVQSREQYETRLFPVGEGPPHPSPTATLEGRAPRTAPPPVTLEDRSDGT